MNSTTKAYKRGFDLVLSLLGLIISSPLWVAIAFAVKLEDGGSVFYIQERWGKNKNTIKVYKFRTMRPDADKRWGSMQAGENDLRITGVGRFLRKFALDELPQLINILKGEMSFVGPRALPINEMQIADEESNLPDERIAGFDLRQSMKPGLTGIAQVYAPRDVARQQKFDYDISYMGKQSILLDASLLLRSLWITLMGGWESRTGEH